MHKLILGFLITIAITFISCGRNIKKYVEVNQEQMELPIVLRLAKDDNTRIITMESPLKIQLKNNSRKKLTFLRIYYKYNERIPVEGKGGFGMGLYKYKNESLNKIKNKKTELKEKETLDYIIYSSHYIDSLESRGLITYIEEMKSLNQDTLAIETVAGFKQIHSELFEHLTKGDSISIQFLDGKKLGERITVPVEW